MTHITGQPDRDLHHAGGSHRGTPASANDRVLESHERRLIHHLELHAAEAEAPFSEALALVREETR